MDEMTEIFETKAEADAFVSGCETAISMIDDDHLTVDEPVSENGRWSVTVRFIV